MRRHVFINDDLESPADHRHVEISEFKVVAQHVLACVTSVRHVGEMIAMAVAPTRADAEDLLEQVEVKYEDLPVLVDAPAAMKNSDVRLHDELEGNVFVTLSYESGFEDKSRAAPIVVKRQMSLARQSMVPLEGKAIVAYWDERADQLVVYSSSQAPHLIRIGIAKFLVLNQNQVRVVSPDVGGGFGYKLDLKPEELCLAWLAKKFRRPFRYIEDRREHLTTGANARQHHYELTAYADERGRLLALDAEVTVDGGAYSNWHQTVALEPSQVLGNLPGPYDFRGYRVKTHCVSTNKPGLLPYRGVARTGVCFAMELMMDALARQVGREPWEVRFDNLVPATSMPYDNVTGKHFDSGDYQKSLLIAREKIGFDQWRQRQRRGRVRRPRDRRGLRYLLRAIRPRHQRLREMGHVHHSRVRSWVRAITPDGGLEIPRRRAFARPGNGNLIRADRPSDPRR